MNFIDPQLQPILDKDAVIIPGSGGGNLQSIGNGRYAMTLPDGTKVVVDQYGNIIGYFQATGKKTRFRKGQEESTPVPAKPAPSGRAVTEGD